MIHPRAEYETRRDELIELADLLGFAYIVPEYDPKEWFAKVKGLEHEPERGARCSVCFLDRLMATALYAKEHGFSHFTTTLATSRWKNKKQVDAAGFAAQEATGVPYWSEDWRKEGLVTRRYQLVKSAITAPTKRTPQRFRSRLKLRRRASCVLASGALKSAGPGAPTKVGTC